MRFKIARTHIANTSFLGRDGSLRIGPNAGPQEFDASEIRYFQQCEKVLADEIQAGKTSGNHHDLVYLLGASAQTKFALVKAGLLVEVEKNSIFDWRPLHAALMKFKCGAKQAEQESTSTATRLPAPPVPTVEQLWAEVRRIPDYEGRAAFIEKHPELSTSRAG